MDKGVVLITGASSGIGKSAATYLSEQGYQVYGTYRRPLEKPPPFALVEMDVNDEPSVRKGLDGILKKEKTIDVLINNAGFGYVGAIEDTSIEEAKAQFETNFFGVLRLCHAVLPIMREQKRGANHQYLFHCRLDQPSLPRPLLGQ